MEATILTPYYPVSGLYRISRDSDGLQLDFMDVVDGISSFEGPRKRSTFVKFGASEILVASLPDIIKSKKAAGRPRDLAVLEVLEKTLEQATSDAQGKTGSSPQGK